MAGGMGEVPGQFPLTKHTPRGTVHFSGSHARSNCRDRGLLRLQHRLIELSSLSRRTPDMHSSRAVRTITGEYNTKIADHEPAPGNARRRGAAMHDRRPLSGSQDGGERHAFTAATTGLVFHGGGHFHLTHSGPNL